MSFYFCHGNKAKCIYIYIMITDWTVFLLALVYWNSFFVATTEPERVCSLATNASFFFYCAL